MAKGRQTPTRRSDGKAEGRQGWQTPTRRSDVERWHLKSKCRRQGRTLRSRKRRPVSPARQSTAVHLKRFPATNACRAPASHQSAPGCLPRVVFYLLCVASAARHSAIAGRELVRATFAWLLRDPLERVDVWLPWLPLGFPFRVASPEPTRESGCLASPQSTCDDRTDGAAGEGGTVRRCHRWTQMERMEQASKSPIGNSRGSETGTRTVLGSQY